MPPEASHQQLGAGGSGGLRPPRPDGCGRLRKPSGVATNANAFGFGFCHGLKIRSGLEIGQGACKSTK